MDAQLMLLDGNGTIVAASTRKNILPEISEAVDNDWSGIKRSRHLSVYAGEAYDTTILPVPLPNGVTWYVVFCEPTSVLTSAIRSGYIAAGVLVAAAIVVSAVFASAISSICITRYVILMLFL